MIYTVAFLYLAGAVITYDDSEYYVLREWHRWGLSIIWPALAMGIFARLVYDAAMSIRGPR